MVIKILNQDITVVLWTLVIVIGFVTTAEACWGLMAPKYGTMTPDFDLLAGEELILNCTLSSNYIKLNQRQEPYYVNSSNLLLRKSSTPLFNFTHTVNGLTAQVRIPTAKVEDSGNYFCEVAVPGVDGGLLVCGSKVSVGYPPKPVKNFKCISTHYENLTCTWNIEKSKVHTRYTLSKQLSFWALFSSLPFQSCPKETSNSTFCQWGVNTDPPLLIKDSNLTFLLMGNNSLGTREETFSIMHREIYVPNFPQDLTTTFVGQQDVILRWSPPKNMEHMVGKPPLRYELWVREITPDTPQVQIIDVGVDVFTYTVLNLIPYMKYNMSLRCLSNFTKLPEDVMWSPWNSVELQTLPDVPYEAPKIAPEAFELHYYSKYRAVTLYWKPVSPKQFHGEDFMYHIVCSRDNSSSLNTTLSSKVVNVTTLSATFSNLQEDSSYTFHLYALNNQGLSKNFSILVVQAQPNIPDVPQDITAISHNLGLYELSWKPSISKKDSEIVDYVVFWCSSLKPWLARCEGPIRWVNLPLSTNKLTLNLSDSSTNFQFAVASRTPYSTSGMKWATCIVPYRAALGKISYVFVEPKNSTSLKVIWRLDCAAQKAVVKRFEIMYCEVDEKQRCKGSKKSSQVIEPKAESYILSELQPFSNYSVIIRAYNLADVPSEDSDPKYQATLQGAPADPPWDVQVTMLSNASLQVSWKSPRRPNGIITHYLVQYNNEVKMVEVDKPQDSYQIDLSTLQYYTNYTIKIQACVTEHFCSHGSEMVVAETDIGVPGDMDPPRIETINSTLMKVSWNKPLQSNGPIDFYEVQWTEMKGNNDSESSESFSMVSTSDSFMHISISCPAFEDGGIKYLFTIRAANIKDGMTMFGPVSMSTQARACLLSQGVSMIVGIAIGGTLALAVILLLVYKIIRWMSEKIHQVKNISVRLPQGLDGPENNPLNNYENLKNGLKPIPTVTIGHHSSYIIEEVDNKNRHGSGSSQYSFSSTEELLYRNGKGTKFTRKSSGESSGCSSLSSNKSQPSSESGTESDFMMPPSPDTVFTNHSGHKSVLPIVLEDKDSTLEDLVKETTDVADGNSTQQPSSKFATTDYNNGLPPLWNKSIAFYNLNLSNSEPSIKDAKDSTCVIMPYSKVGIAKSSNDIIGLTTSTMDLGYSRIGVAPNLNSAVLHSLNLSNQKLDRKLDTRYINGIVVLPNLKKDIDIENENGLATGDENLLKHMLATTVNTKINGNNGEESGYIKFRKTVPVISKSDYVPFSDLNNFNKTYPLLHVPILEEPLDTAEVFTIDPKIYDVDNFNQLLSQKYPEYNPDAVAVIFDGNMNTLPILDDSYYNTSGGKCTTELDTPALDDDVSPGFDVNFASVQTEPLIESVDETMPLDLEEDTAVSSNDSTIQPFLPKTSNGNYQSAKESVQPDGKSQQNGYVPLSSLTAASAGLVQGQNTDLSQREKSDVVIVPEDNVDKHVPRTYSKCKVYPVLSDTPKYSFSEESSDTKNSECTSDKGQIIFHLNPSYESEYCEV